ncbi:NAD(P)/FAD-dependent oxidoreductase [Saccharolobus islandicus]|uniref:FAD dependent oxidoreductase n=1 Tax=Saccharolobus islandicus (strain M.16.27) TaxID=427318 RepID=C3N0L4_SACI3|nr:NAD(P)/FAD-dependent oxidoreductase [Sulfolobus islandicus]ACP54175.1 FAD dependent oxidoreductase [Sulfolobus islandicus M.16.27]
MTRIAIVGAGPAGLSLAYFLKGNRKVDATIYESMEEPGLKPCAWGLITGIENIIPIPTETIISEIRGFRIYLDNKLVFDIRTDNKLGYIIDKPLFLKRLSEEVNVEFNSKVIQKDDKYYVNNKPIDHDKVIFATGHYSVSKSMSIPAIQYITDYEIDKEIVEFYFYSGFLGYAWVFPDREGSKIGIGGYAEVPELKERLKQILKGRIKMFHGARVTDYGVIEDRLDGNYTGEALGTVYAITGEGIRPSIISSKILADSILTGKDFKKEFKKSKLYWSLKWHAKIIKMTKERDPTTVRLSKALLNNDPQLILKFAIGDFNRVDLIKIFGRSLI